MRVKVHRRSEQRKKEAQLVRQSYASRIGLCQLSPDDLIEVMSVFGFVKLDRRKMRDRNSSDAYLPAHASDVHKRKAASGRPRPAPTLTHGILVVLAPNKPLQLIFDLDILFASLLASTRPRCDLIHD